MLILWWWVLTSFISEMLTTTQPNLSSSPSVWGCQLGFSKIPDAFANNQFFESLAFNMSAFHIQYIVMVLI